MAVAKTRRVKAIRVEQQLHFTHNGILFFQASVREDLRINLHYHGDGEVCKCTEKSVCGAAVHFLL